MKLEWKTGKNGIPLFHCEHCDGWFPMADFEHHIAINLYKGTDQQKGVIKLFETARGSH